VIGVALVTALVAGCGRGPTATTGAGGASGPGGSTQAGPQSAADVLAALADLPEAERTQRLYEGARREGKVIGYMVGSIDSWEALKKDFESRYPGVTFEFLRASGEELLERMLVEHRAGKLVPDIIDNNKIHVLEDADMVIPYTSPAKERMPALVKGPTYADTDINPIVIAWNTNLIRPADAPKRWEDLLDPKYKGKMALDTMPDLMFYGFYEKWGVDRARDYMRRLMQQDIRPSRSHTTALDQLAAGEYALSPELYGYAVVHMKRDKGAPVDWVLPDPMPSSGGGIMIAKPTSRPHAAALFYDYMMSPEAGTLYGQFGRLPVQPGAQLKWPEDQRPMLQHPGLMNSGPDIFRKWHDMANKDIRDIVQPVLGQ
jgi:iron(III) transport system substrate-binding protein